MRLILFLLRLYLVDIPGRPALFFEGKQEELILREELEEVEEGEIMAGM